MPHYVCALPNKKGTAAPLEFISDDPAKIEEWARRHDREGWGVYDCHNPLKPGATRRSKETVAEVRDIFVDIDPKDIVETVAEVDARVDELLLPFSWYNDSGRGRHGGYRLKEPISTDDKEMVARVDAVRERLTEILCGDRQVLHHAALIRRPGTHNTKDGGWLECRTLSSCGGGYDLTELEEMVALYDRPLLTRKPAANGGDNVAYIDFGAPKAPVDVEERLAEMRYGGANDTGINATWWVCMGSLLRQGMSVVEVMDTLHAAARASCQDDPNKDNWYRDLAGMAERWLNYEPEFVHGLDAPVYRQWQAAVAAGKKPRLVWQQNYGLHVRGLSQATPQPLGAAVVDGTTGATITPLPREERAPGIEARPFRRFDPAKLPRREWLYGGHYQRGVLTATVGPGAGGKSSLDLTELIAICTARNLLGEQPTVRCRAWYHNAEDSLNEIYRRIAAICQHYGIDQAELEGWLFVTSGVEMPIQFATSRNGKVSLDAATTAAIIRTITDNEIGVSSFDPLVAHHTVTENATGDMDQVCRELARIANVTDCATEIVHHTRKPAPGQEELSVIDSRGAGAIINAVRSARVLNPMSKTEADKAGIDDVDRRLHFRIDNGKANMAPPSAARWRKFIGVDLPNGDNVGVVTAWEYPTAAAAAVDLPDVVCAQIHAEVAKGTYKAAVQSPDWIGNLVARLLHIDRSTKPGRTAVDRYLHALFNKGVITTADGATGGHKVRVVVPGAWGPTQPTV